MAMRRRIMAGNRELFSPLPAATTPVVVWEDRDKDLQSLFVNVDDANTVIRITDGAQYKLEFTPQQLWDQGFSEYIEHQPFCVRFDPVNFVFTVMIVFREGIELSQIKLLLRPAVAIRYSYEVVLFERPIQEGKEMPVLSDKYGTKVTPVPPKAHVPPTAPVKYVPSDAPLVRKPFPSPGKKPALR